MSVKGWFKKQWKKSSVHYIHAQIPTAQQDVPVVEVTLEAEKHYFRLWLAEMFLKDDKRVFRSYVPVVHSAVSL